MDMEKRTLIIIISAVVIVLGTGGYFILQRVGLDFFQPGSGSSKELAPGASQIGEGKVLAPSGEAARTDVSPNSPQAPQSSLPLSQGDISKIEKEAPGKVVKLNMSVGSVSPASFEANKGEVVTLIVSSGDGRTHIFAFESPALNAVRVGVSSDKVRSMSFNAPDKTGEYVFYCDVPGHRNRGEEGKMIVK